jgi:intracellular sulfur oxidation DsrE/DsrF family protein
VKRAQSLTVGGVIEIRMCRAAAKRRGLMADDIHGFISMVPMADAEIVKLQSEGYAYMQ